jgi:hypothetical protein
MSFMKPSLRAVLTVVAAAVVIGGLVRLSLDKRIADVALPEPSDARARLAP